MAEERVQRRLAAILAADVVGYSRLMEADERGTLDRLKLLRQDVLDPAVARFGGRIFKTTGDGALAEFPSAVDAVQCAVEVQRALVERNEEIPAARRIALRIGISLGDVIVEEGGDLYGNGVNVAARLEAMADAGGICVSGNVHEHTRSAASILFEDLGEQQVKNIERPVRAYRVLLDGPALDDEHPAPKLPVWRRWPAVAAGAALLLAGVLAWWQPWVKRFEPASVERMAFALPDKPSIAVLPFNDFSKARDQEYFADGLTEEIISNLATFENIFVIARNSTNKFKGKAVDVREVAENLGVRYVLEGSIRRSGDDLRVTAQLIDAISGRHIWARKFDRQMRDIFALQDEITSEIASRLVSKVAVAEFERRSRRQTRSPEAYSLFLQGWNAFKQSNPTSNAQAIRFLKQSISEDPKYGRAYALLGWAHRHNAVRGWGNSAEDTLDHALDLTKKGVALAPEDPLTYRYLGNVEREMRHIPEALAASERAVALSPSNSAMLMSYANTLARAGRAEEAVRAMELALRLDPHGPFLLRMVAGLVFFHTGRYEKSIVAFERARRINPRGRAQAMAYRAAAYAQLGKMDEARTAREAYLKLRPNYSIESARRPLQAWPPKIQERAEEGLRKAGFPEYSPPAKSDVPHLSIVVLPFDNLSGVPKQDYLADGITEDLITDLSRIRGAFVIARGTSFTFKGKAVNAKDVAKDLDVRYVLEGSVRRYGDRVRVNAQLIDGATGAHVWSHRFDREVKDVFSLQNEVTSRIAGSLKYELRQAESLKLRGQAPKNLTAWELALQGAMNLLTKPRSTETYLQAKALLERSLSLDPSLAIAWTGLARIYLRAGTSGLPGIARAEARKRMLEVAQQAVALNPNGAEALAYLGNAYRLNRRFEDARVACARAAELNPNDDLAYSCLGRVMTGLGRTEEAIPLFEKALRLDPYYVAAPQHFFLGMAYLITKRHEEAAVAFRKSSSIDLSFATPHMGLASALAWMGRLEEAKQELADFRKNDMGGMKSLKQVKARLSVFSPKLDYVLEGLRKAGMPEK